MFIIGKVFGILGNKFVMIFLTFMNLPFIVYNFKNPTTVTLLNSFAFGGGIFSFVYLNLVDRYKEMLENK